MSCQDACVVMDFDGSTDFFREVTRRAAKPHRCCECSDPIAVGESHEYAAGKSDGMFWDYRTCAACIEIRKTFVCDSFVFETLWEEIDDQLFRDWNEMTAIDCLARLTTERAVEKMRAQYELYRESLS